ncbi:hypothetical protein CORC01_04909 [Colletotrichum orchidophilum]|uniref:Peptidase A1 domain-containing protein n=1 Tax=Colletotrichum orchidophilum TaxID=1209926 RepID=A0A1G4BEI3_9PEZI|nr:uncharacterized protein CORC01_04909 [Colletotrichum orchidophilum]OHE99773.1 hypothetical protein CORC01_04909 [Colletotrichum orchidophilum]
MARFRGVSGRGSGSGRVLRDVGEADGLALCKNASLPAQRSVEMIVQGDDLGSGCVDGNREVMLHGISDVKGSSTAPWAIQEALFWFWVRPDVRSRAVSVKDVDIGERCWMVRSRRPNPRDIAKNLSFASSVRMAVSLLLFLLEGVMSVKADCSPYPISLPIGNVTLSNGKVARGLNLAVGSPAQTFAFMPHCEKNGSLLYGNDGYCNLEQADITSKDSCTSYRGGAYDSIESITRKTADLDTFPDDGNLAQLDPITDTLKLNDNVTLENVQFGIAKSAMRGQGYPSQVVIGLGSRSPFLQALKSSSKIASRSWSFFWGRGFGMESQFNGHVVFGGYDRAKIKGKRYTQPLADSSSPCGSRLVVTISDLKLNFPNGSESSLFSPSLRPIDVCVSPHSPFVMTMPYNPVFMYFLDQTGSSMLNFTRSLDYHDYDMRYIAPSRPFVGDFTVSLSSGLNIRIPNEYLVIPHVSLDKTTGDTLVNTTGPDLLFNSLQADNANDMPQLGWQFLAAAYLQVNQEASQFSLWEANPTPNEDLVAVDADDKDVTNFCRKDGSDADSGGNSSPSPSPQPAPSDSYSTGTIVGIAVGAGAAVLLAVGVAVWFWFWRRKKKKAQAEVTQWSVGAPVNGGGFTNTENPEQHHYSSSYNVYAKAELTAEESITGPRYEMAG